MNINHNIRQCMLLGLTAVAAGMFTSCKDYPDAYEVADGTPSVYYVRSLSQEFHGSNDAADKHYTSGELVTEASPASVLALIGENLRSVQEVLFNDKHCAKLNPSYITDNTLILSIPDSVPKNVTDKIYLVTANKDTVSYDFHVVIPAPQMSQMSNEYAPAGEDVTLTGGYFVDDPSVPLSIEFNGLDGNIVKIDHDDLSVTDDYTSVTFTMPEGVSEGPIVATSLYGTSTSSFYYTDSRNMLFDFDDIDRGNHGWHDRDILSDETSLTGNFVQLGNGSATMTEAGGWDDSNFSFEYWAGSWDNPQNITTGNGAALYNVVDFSNWKNKSLKFEMYIPSSSQWKAGAMQICFEGFDKVSLSGNPIEGVDKVAGANAYVFNGEGSGDEGLWGRAMYRPWTNGIYDTGDRWQTVTIPLSSFTLDRTGATTTKLFTSVADFASFNIFVMGGGVNGTECTPIIKIDNIRVIPNK